jgi:hypothetical protein
MAEAARDSWLQEVLEGAEAALNDKLQRLNQV